MAFIKESKRIFCVWPKQNKKKRKIWQKGTKPTVPQQAEDRRDRFRLCATIPTTTPPPCHKHKRRGIACKEHTSTHTNKYTHTHTNVHILMRTYIYTHTHTEREKERGETERKDITNEKNCCKPEGTLATKRKNSITTKEDKRVQHTGTRDGDAAQRSPNHILDG